MTSVGQGHPYAYFLGHGNLNLRLTVFVFRLRLWENSGALVGCEMRCTHLKKTIQKHVFFMLQENSADG